MKKNIILYLLILGFTTPLLAVKHGEQISSSDTLKIGDLCPYFAMEDTSRVQVSLKSLRGKYVYIDVWASWCSPCKKEYPSFHKLEEELNSDDIVFLSVSTDVSIFRWSVGLGGLYNGAKEKKGMHWRVLDDEFEAKFNIYRLPRFILLDKDGRVIRKDMTRPSKPVTKKYLVELLGLQALQKTKEYRIVVKMEHVNKEAPAILGYMVDGKFHIDTCFANSNHEFILKVKCQQLMAHF